MAVILRDYQPQDRTQLIALFDQFLMYLVALDPLHRLKHTSGYAETILNKDLKEVQEQQGQFTVAVDGSTIVGFVVGVIQERRNQPDVHDFVAGRVTELFVDDSVRGNGIGSRLMEHVESYFRSRGCDTAKVEVFAPNVAARRLYAKLGYQPRDIDNIKRL